MESQAWRVAYEVCGGESREGLVKTGQVGG
jgi:hypothetical protein